MPKKITAVLQYAVIFGLKMPKISHDYNSRESYISQRKAQQGYAKVDVLI